MDVNENDDSKAFKENTEKAVYWYKKSFDAVPDDGTAYDIADNLFALEQYAEALIWAQKAKEIQEMRLKAPDSSFNASDEETFAIDIECLIDKINECL